MSLFHLSSCIPWYHIYKDVWTASAGAVLQCEQESRNNKDPYVVVVQSVGLTVGHVPCTISCLCSVFVWHGGSIVCTIIGASIAQAVKSLVKMSTTLKYLIVFLAILHKRNVCLLHMHLPIDCPLYMHFALRNCKNFAILILQTSMDL